MGVYEKMADVYIHYGTDMQNMTYALLQRADIKSRLRTSMRVCIKPNLVVSRPADEGATTHPEIVEGIVQYLQDSGLRDIVIAEGSWVGDSTRRAWQNCGYAALAKQYGVELVDTKQDKVLRRKAGKLELEVCESIASADYLINVPVLKGHCQTDMTCCLKNMKGCIPDSEKRRYHSMGLHKPIALLNTQIVPDLHVIDSICGDLTFEEGGNPIASNRILLGFNAVLLDSYCAQLMGYRPDEIHHLRHARDYGVGEYADENTQIVEMGTDARPQTVMQRSSIAKKLSRFVEEDSACSACYAALMFALHKIGGAGAEKIKIGQGFKGKEPGGIGVGNCTKGCARFVPGCPPKAVDIVEFLQENAR